MPRLEIVTMRTHRISFPIPYLFCSIRGLSRNDLLWSLMVSFGKQSPNYTLLKMVI